jgi:hypothetical protein
MFWKTNQKKLKEGVDYQLVDIEDSDLTAVKIISGKFSEVMYHYNGAKIVEEGVMARLQFGYNIINPGKFSTEQLTTNQQFSTLMGDILTQLILKEEVYGQTRAFDTEEFDL